jgi:hypothetical protein
MLKNNDDLNNVIGKYFPDTKVEDLGSDFAKLVYRSMDDFFGPKEETLLFNFNRVLSALVGNPNDEDLLKQKEELRYALGVMHLCRVNSILIVAAGMTLDLNHIFEMQSMLGKLCIQYLESISA